MRQPIIIAMLVENGQRKIDHSRFSTDHLNVFCDFMNINKYNIIQLYPNGIMKSSLPRLDQITIDHSPHENG